jgi:hypothetical protein
MSARDARRRNQRVRLGVPIKLLDGRTVMAVEALEIAALSIIIGRGE